VARAVLCEPERRSFLSRRFSDYRFHSIRSLADCDLHFTSRGAKASKSEPQSRIYEARRRTWNGVKIHTTEMIIDRPPRQILSLARGSRGFIEPSETMASVDGFRPINHLFLCMLMCDPIVISHAKAIVLREFFPPRTEQRSLQPSSAPRLLSWASEFTFQLKLLFIFAFLMFFSSLRVHYRSRAY
jgi:hypothetical protein